MAKPVMINSIAQPFTTQKAALEYFHAMKEKYEDGVLLSGSDAVEIAALYEQYCLVTNWQMPLGITGFSVDKKAEEVSPGIYRTQKCFWYHLADGSKNDFSAIKAVQKISRAQNA